MIRQGKLCKECKPTQCNELGSDLEPNVIECPSCDGVGCEQCEKTGGIKIAGCPNVACSQMAPTIDLIDMFHGGMPPIIGGVLDQAAWFIDAAKWLKRDEAKAKE